MADDLKVVSSESLPELSVKESAPLPKGDHDQPESFWDTVYDRSGLGAIQKLSGSLADWAAKKSEEKQTENLTAAAKGQQSPEAEGLGVATPRSAYDALSHGARMLSTAFSPKAVATTGVVAAANTNPFTGIPVDAALVAHGLYGAAKNAPEALKGNPEAAEQALLSGSEAAGGAAGLGATRPATGAAGKSLSERLYQSALKPSTTLEPAERAAILKTGLEKKIPVSDAGADMIANSLKDLQGKVQATINTNPNAPISKFAVASRLNRTAANAADQVNPIGDLSAISESGQEFLNTQPANIPASQAQKIKVGTYKALGDKSFGELKGATVEAQKSLAQGLKEELENKFPELKGLNAQQAKLFDLAVPINRAIGRIDNKELLGIGTPIAGGAAESLTGNMNAGRAAAVLKAVLDNPAVKSNLAIMLNKASKGKLSPLAADAKVAAYASSLATQAANQGGEQ